MLKIRDGNTITKSPKIMRTAVAKIPLNVLNRIYVKIRIEEYLH